VDALHSKSRRRKLPNSHIMRHLYVEVLGLTALTLRVYLTPLFVPIWRFTPSGGQSIIQRVNFYLPKSGSQFRP
jgi:hypothetical protein